MPAAASGPERADAEPRIAASCDGFTISTSSHSPKMARYLARAFAGKAPDPDDAFGSDEEDGIPFPPW